ncbi:RNA 2',3'-cyclic phosphodiesterase [Risungbinella massiliensis]|uniref:RNA 2',3'-cyclic phosphodiesterase n=1 Tax=Risungbinella massiliensis TaxID=1329796 RepID=UPI0005CBBC87|nr:RNA 2',3'-cyclic phosphodiesterase [Risungbinella massiliensis]
MNRQPEPRLFVAVPLPNLVKHQLAKWITSKKSEWKFSKWVYEQDLHLTLHFLGITTDQQMKEIIPALQEIVKKQNSFTLELDELGTFGRTEQPRILWAGVRGELHQLNLLQKEVVTALSSIGFPAEDRPYRPHVTLARKYQQDHFPIAQLNQDYLGELSDRKWTVQEIVLYETKLGQKPMYHVVSSFPFST